MKWLFKGKRGKRSRSSAKRAQGQRVTGVKIGLPAGVRFALLLTTSLLVAVLMLWGVWGLFKAYYFRSPSLFTLRNLHENVVISTGNTLTPDLICAVLGLHEGVNLFEIPIARRRQEFLKDVPNIKEMSITRHLPDSLSINVIEREPLARVGSGGRVVDEEGVIFIRYAGVDSLPLVKGSDFCAEFLPGERLRGPDMAAIRLVQATQRPGNRMYLSLVDATRLDYLLLTFVDGRRAKIAWEGMGEECCDSSQAMLRQIDELEKVMDSEIGRASPMLNATIPGRIFASMMGM